MKVLHLSTSDLGGGAARAAYRVHQSCLDAGMDSRMLVHQRLSRDPSVTRFQASAKPMARAARAIRRKQIERAAPRQSDPAKHGPFSEDRSWLGSELLAGLPACDLIHLHWVAGFVDFQSFLPEAAKRFPLVWTLHDMNPFTGGCHYDGKCGRFGGTCGNCPMLVSGGETDFSRRVWQRKEAALAGIPSDRLNVVTPSQWLTGEAARSSLFGRFETTTIPYGLNTERFAPRDKRFAREVLGIPQDARVVLFVAQTIRDERKGHRYLMEAFESIENAFLLSVGSGDASGKKNALHLGFVEVDQLVSMIYSAADVFAAPSLEDNLPQTVLEAMACGVPVVGTRVGGIPDAVRHGETGLLAPAGDPGALREALASVLGDDPARRRMAARAREVAVAEFGSLKQAHAYTRIYEQLLTP